jgi:phosphoglycerate kinase
MYSNKKTLIDINLTNKTVILRADLNVPVKNGIINDDKRIKSTIPTIDFLLSKGAKIVILSHLSRIKKVEDLYGAKSLKPVAMDLAKKLTGKANVSFLDVNTGQRVTDFVKNMKSKDIVVLENTRYNDFNITKNEVVKLESKNNPELAKFWASLGDVFVNDAFGTAHRAHASNVGIASNVKESCVGLLVEEELKKLGAGLDNPKKPYVAIVGGAKVSDKIGVIKTLIKDADKILIGGGMAYTFLKSQGHKIGTSLVEDDQLQVAKEILDMSNGKLFLPVDHLCASEFSDVTATTTTSVEIPDNMMALDIGPKTIKKYQELLMGAKTIAWNGPLGVFEFSNYANGTKKICETIAMETKKGCYSIIGGGDSASAAIKLGFEKEFTHISTGGGASLAYIEKVELPGIKSLSNK